VLVTEGLKTTLKRRRGSLVCGPGIEKMGVS